MGQRLQARNYDLSSIDRHGEGLETKGLHSKDQNRSAGATWPGTKSEGKSGLEGSGDFEK